MPPPPSGVTVKTVTDVTGNLCLLGLATLLLQYAMLVAQ
jgi:Mg/Co/Ni transporter MgtE